MGAYSATAIARRRYLQTLIREGRSMAKKV
jgi:hypothetical protein